MDDGNYHFKVGNFDCIAVSDVTNFVPLVGAAFFLSKVPEEELNRALKAYNASPAPRPMEWSFLFVKAGDHQVLIDTGSGPGYHPNSGQLRRRLENVGLDPADIDIVMLTHIHHDHIGGVTDDAGDLAFPNARFLMSKEEWAFCTTGFESRFLAEVPREAAEPMKDLVRKRLQRLRERLDLIEAGDEIVLGIRTIAAFGHTPGHMALDIRSGGEQLLFIADTVHYELQMEHTDWSVVFDMDPEQAVATRRRLLEQAAKEGALVMGCHLEPFPGLGHVVEQGQGWRWLPLDVRR